MQSMRIVTRSIAALSVAGALVGLLVPVNAWGEPPPWAPAHGWRKKNDPYYAGYTGKRWEKDYGIVSGRCNREAIGAVLGGVAGGAIGSQVGRGSGRQVAIVIGTVTGSIIGAHIGRSMDEADRACIGHALELAGDHRRVAWQGANGLRYELMPVQGFQHLGQKCREFDLTVIEGRRKNTHRSMACPAGDGAWRIL